MKNPLAGCLLCLTVITASGQVSPLLSTTWNQTCNYNANCPVVVSGGACGRAFTGCGATAMAQAMKFWQHPASGWDSHSYTPTGYPLQSANFATASYNYAAMPNAVSSANSDVAQLMHHCGISVDMQYGGTSSNAYFGDLAAALKKYFRYSLTTHVEMKWAHTDSAWTEMIKAELDAGRPVIFSGSSHFWVVDGYQYAPGIQFHMNWGWGGTYNGYYALNDLTPGSNSFPNSAIIISLKPASPFETSPDTVETSYFASTFNSYEVSSQTAFTVNSLSTWITPDSTGGIPGYHKDNFSVTSNNSYFGRYGYVVISNGTLTDTLVVHQDGHPLGLDLSTDTLFFSYGGGFQNADIWTSSSWTLSNTALWCTPTVTSGSGNTALGVTASPNTGAQRIHTYSLSNGTFTQNLVIVQEASPTANLPETDRQTCTIFPNPFHNLINLQCQGIDITQVEWLDISGRICAQSATPHVLNVFELTPGVYTARITTGNGVVYVVKVVKE